MINFLIFKNTLNKQNNSKLLLRNLSTKRPTSPDVIVYNYQSYSFGSILSRILLVIIGAGLFIYEVSGVSQDFLVLEYFSIVNSIFVGISNGNTFLINCFNTLLIIFHNTVIFSILGYCYYRFFIKTSNFGIKVSKFFNTFSK